MGMQNRSVERRFRVKRRWILSAAFKLNYIIAGSILEGHLPAFMSIEGWQKLITETSTMEREKDPESGTHLPGIKIFLLLGS